MFVKEMYDKGSESEGTKRARALYHIDSILRSNKLSNKRVGIDEVQQFCFPVFRIDICFVKQLQECILSTSLMTCCGTTTYGRCMTRPMVSS